jgi:hypothetical protein
MKTAYKIFTCSFLLFYLICISQVIAQQNEKFEVKGPTQPVKIEPDKFRGAIQVSFDMLPTTMSFDLPWTYAMVNQKGVRFSTLAAETYDPRDFDGTGGLAGYPQRITLWKGGLGGRMVYHLSRWCSYPAYENLYWPGFREPSLWIRP